MKRNNYSIKLIGCVYCFFFLAFFSFQSNAYPAPSDYFDNVQKIFIGYYQRPAAPAGLNYWSNRISESGGNQYEVIEAFANSPEAQGLYGPITSANIRSVVTTIFEALFNRTPGQAGLDFYENGFNLGQFTPATIMLNVLDGATGTDLQSVNNKLAASGTFTGIIDPEFDGTNFQVTYSGEPDAIAGRSFLTSVTSDPATIPDRDEITEYMQDYIAIIPSDPIVNQGMSLADLNGVWEVNSMNSPSPDWQRGSITIGSDGSFSGWLYQSNGSPNYLYGTMSITPDGIITATGPQITPSFRCVMDSGKSVAVCTFTLDVDVSMAIFTRKAASYSLADLSGMWEMNSLMSSSSWWERGPVTIGSDGSFSATSTGSDGSPGSASGTMSITYDGIISVTGADIPLNLRCVMDSGKSVVACTSSDIGDAGMMIFTKKAVRYYQGDLSGMWEMNALTSFYSWWERGSMAIGSDGSFSVMSNGSDGSTTPVSGTFSVTHDGIITATGAGIPSSLKCVMDSGKTVAVCTFTDLDGDTFMMILTKRPVLYP